MLTLDPAFWPTSAPGVGLHRELIDRIHRKQPARNSRDAGLILRDRGKIAGLGVQVRRGGRDFHGLLLLGDAARKAVWRRMTRDLSAIVPRGFRKPTLDLIEPVTGD